MDPHRITNINDTITINDHNSSASDREATNQESPPDFHNSSATTLFEETNTQYIRETVCSYEANSRERNPQSNTPMRNCVVCGYEVEELSIMIAPCGHTYCGKCINKLFDRAAGDEYSFPPKCCGQIITQEHVERFLSPDIYKRFQEKSEEFSTTDRTYCSDPKCVTFISSNATVGDTIKPNALLVRSRRASHARRKPTRATAPRIRSYNLSWQLRRRRASSNVESARG